jgi:hypothetical protein
MTRRRKDETLEEFAKRIQPSTIGHIPVDTLTKENVRTLAGDDPRHRIYALMTSRASNRDFVIESAGLLDDQLEELLATIGEKKGAKMIDRINSAFRASLIGDGDRNMLSAIAKIRGQFAHDPNVMYFEVDPRVRDWCEVLTMANEPPGSLRERFGYAVATLSFVLTAAIERARATPDAPDKQ